MVCVGIKSLAQSAEIHRSLLHCFFRSNTPLQSGIALWWRGFLSCGGAIFLVTFCHNIITAHVQTAVSKRTQLFAESHVFRSNALPVSDTSSLRAHFARSSRVLEAIHPGSNFVHFLSILTNGERFKLRYHLPTKARVAFGRRCYRNRCCSAVCKKAHLLAPKFRTRIGFYSCVQFSLNVVASIQLVIARSNTWRLIRNQR